LFQLGDHKVDITSEIPDTSKILSVLENNVTEYKSIIGLGETAVAKLKKEINASKMKFNF